MKLTISCVVLLIGLMISVTNGDGLRGKEFWFGFTPQAYYTLSLRVVIVSEYTGVAYIEYNDTTRSVDLEPGTSATYDIDQTLQGTELLIENKGIMVYATVEVNVFLLNYSPYTSDASTVLPTPLLSTSYIVSAGSRYSFGAQILIVSPYDNNDVNITLRLQYGSSMSYQGSTYYSGDVLSLRMDKFDTFVLRSYYALSGTHLTSSEPVSVLYGEDEFIGPSWYSLEMVLPKQSDSYDFIVPVFEGGGGYNGFLNIVSSKENTSVSVENTTWHLQAAERLEISRDVGLPTAITATKGVFVTLYVYGYDSFLITIPGVNQYMFQYNFFVFNESFNSSVSIVIPESSNVSMIVMDGDPIDTLHTTYIDVNNTIYTVCTMYVSPGAHFITHLTQQRFGLFVYGTKEYITYGYVPDINIGGCKSNPCHNNGTCQGTISSYVCTCAEGFTSTNCEIGTDEAMLTRDGRDSSCYSTS